MLRGVLVWLRTGQMIPHKRHEFFIGGIQGRPHRRELDAVARRRAPDRDVAGVDLPAFRFDSGRDLLAASV